MRKLSGSRIFAFEWLEHGLHFRTCFYDLCIWRKGVFRTIVPPFDEYVSRIEGTPIIVFLCTKNIWWRGGVEVDTPADIQFHEKKKKTKRDSNHSNYRCSEKIRRIVCADVLCVRTLPKKRDCIEIISFRKTT